MAGTVQSPTGIPQSWDLVVAARHGAQWPPWRAHRPQRGRLLVRGGEKYPAIVKLWSAACEQFAPFLAFPPEIRSLVYATNTIELLDARLRQATRRRGHFPDPDAALKVLYLVIQDHKPNRKISTGPTVVVGGESTLR